MDSPLTLWKCPRKYRRMNLQKRKAKREKRGVIAAGNEVPPLIKKLKKMGFPDGIISCLKNLGIKKLTPIQMQALPCILSCRNTIMYSCIRTGKTLCFLLPIIMGAFEEEKRLPLVDNEGPIGLIITPSRELALQTKSSVQSILKGLEGFPSLNVNLCIGGMEFENTLGCHITIATPGRLADMIRRQRIDLTLCKIIVLDEADRLLDSGFEEHTVSLLLNNRSKQIVLSTSAIPKNLQCLSNPVLIGINRRKLKKLKITQETEHVVDKFANIIETYRKTQPPTLIFCENKQENERLLKLMNENSISAYSLHGGRSPSERTEALQKFYDGDCDVLVATDIAAKGINFENLNHIINFDMPKDIDSYFQRISRIPNTGLVSNYANNTVDRRLLTQLKAYFEWTRLPFPSFMNEYCDDPQVQEDGSCTYCQLRGHSKFSCKIYQESLLNSALF